MIREAQRSELPAILELWLESTTWGHPFIKANYWRDCIPLVRDAYLANAQNWVWEEDGSELLPEEELSPVQPVTERASRIQQSRRIHRFIQNTSFHDLPEASGRGVPFSSV